ncbi:MAG: 4'-phosphopantetheinyl transferase superfamily protein, partial [Acidimicrobiia bacterium]|nr:4'-phosphopantetheinyl transferase superfamily protein [Acidimicrobiia bacterium]
MVGERDREHEHPAALPPTGHRPVLAGYGHGRPPIDFAGTVQIDGEQAAVDISMTDRSGWAVCLVGQPGSMASGTVGVDLEVVEPRTARFVHDYFTPVERTFVKDQPDHRHDELANLIWSAKEAALKVQQVGLRADTRTVEV